MQLAKILINGKFIITTTQVLRRHALVHFVPHPFVREAEEQAHVLREAVVVVGHEVAVLRRGQILALAQPAAEEEKGPERAVQRGRLATDINTTKNKPQVSPNKP